VVSCSKRIGQANRKARAERRVATYDVHIRFLDGTSIRFSAYEFNVNVGPLPTEEKPKRFYYKDANGRDTPIYLRLDHVAAIVVTPAGSNTRSITRTAQRMPQVQELMSSNVTTIESSASVVEVARTMIDEGRGPLLVMDGNRPVAMVTDRDLVAYVVAQGLDPNQVTLEDVQMRPLITIDSDQDAEEARRLMDEHGLNRLVVVDDDELAGIVSEADLRSDEEPAA
jgi:CBS domain-containing protein